MSHRFVQACITAVGFPDNFDDLDAMIAKNGEVEGALTDIDCLLKFRPGARLTWSAPKWLSTGDLLFFYHTKSARRNVRFVREDVEDSAPANDDLWAIIARAEEQLALYSETVFACALVAGPSEYQDAPSDEQHFKGRIFAPLQEVAVFDRPVSARVFNEFLTLSPGATITPLHGASISSLIGSIASTNSLPSFMTNVQPGTAGFRNVNAETWMSIVCQPSCAFIDESQLRGYFLDHLLQALKDPRSALHLECACIRDGAQTGIADYYVRINGQWIPVEAKLNVRAEADLRGQVRKYLNADYVLPKRGSSRGDRVEVSRPRIALVVDQLGIYLMADGEFVECEIIRPLWHRTSINEQTVNEVRSRIGALQSSFGPGAT